MAEVMISGFTLWLDPPPHSNRVATATRHVTDNAMRKSDFITPTNPRVLLLAADELVMMVIFLDVSFHRSNP
jgi:hypothetical protein